VIFKPYTRVNLLPDGSRWVTSWENRALGEILRKLNIDVVSRRLTPFQVCYLPSKYYAVSRGFYHNILRNRLAFDYYHGDPSITPAFKPLFEKLKQKRRCFHRIRVSHKGIEKLLQNEGFSDQVFRIPIGIEFDWFPLQTPESKRSTREHLGIPQSAVVIGSFQKDGNGWGEGNEPKLIKGPDILLETLKILKSRIPELFVLLTGPARGYVKTGLESLNIPYKHHYFQDYREIWKNYHAIDTYLVSSREEGGPKSILESMASGVPLISTRVGQAQDLVRHGINGWLTEVEDAEGLADHALQVFEGAAFTEEVRKNARHTAEQNSYANQLELWREFFQPLLSSPPR
jgi:glycosyltransferase involved in cell wall biosynthesis